MDLRTFALLGIAALAASSLVGQGVATRSAGTTAPPDPYTGGEPAAMQRAGYVGFGPFDIGGYHGTPEVDKLVGPGRTLWLETEHFKLGAQFPPYPMRGDSTQRKKIRAELTALKRTLPKVDAGTDELDPWLRMHLLARRCEAVYADFRDRLGHVDGDFPATPGRAAGLGDEWTGLGPYLGQCGKYVVLVFGSAADFGRYSAEFLGDTYRWPQRYDLGWKRSLLFGTALDFDGGLQDDTALHCHIVYSVVHNLCEGYRHLCHETPVWFKCGLAQWYARRIDPNHPNFDRPPNGRPDGRLGNDWVARVAGLVRNDAARPLREMATWRDYTAFHFHDYVLAWSRVDFLMSKGDHDLARYLFRMKTPFGRSPGTPDWQLVLERQDQAIQEAWGFANFDELDAAWKEHVRKTYRDR